jgi:hypothetical protein
MKQSSRSISLVIVVASCWSLMCGTAFAQAVLARFEMPASPRQLEREIAGHAQLPARSDNPASLPSAPAAISVVALEGEGVINNVRSPVARNLVVRVEDDDHRPVAAASVTFVLPSSGASGEFPNGARSVAVLTDNRGIAAARGFRTNQIPGKLDVYVVASYRGLRATAFISQMIEGPTAAAEAQARKGGGKWKWVGIGIAAAGGAGAGIYFGTQGRSSTSSAPISISAGQPVFGSPR